MSTMIGVYADRERLNGPQYLGWLHATSAGAEDAKTNQSTNKLPVAAGSPVPLPPKRSAFSSLTSNFLLEG